MTHLYTVTGPPGYVYLTRSVGPRWASQENFVAMVRPEEGQRIVAIVNESTEALLAAAKLALETAEQWIHSELGNTSFVKGALRKLASVHAAIEKAE